MQHKYPPLSALTIDAVQAEVVRSLAQGRDRCLLNPHLPDVEKLSALVEGLGSVGKSLTSDQESHDHVKSLIRLAGAALAWAESIEG
jgi:hypothetical protein